MNIKLLDIGWLIALICLIFFIGCAHQQTITGKGAESIDTFRGVVWGSQLADADHLIVDQQTGNLAYARNPNETLLLGAATVEEITYYFVDDLFVRAQVKFYGLENFALVKRSLINQLGETTHNDIASNIFI
jgi:hypothetical protein